MGYDRRASPVGRTRLRVSPVWRDACWRTPARAGEGSLGARSLRGGRRLPPRAGAPRGRQLRGAGGSRGIMAASVPRSSLRGSGSSIHSPARALACPLRALAVALGMHGSSFATRVPTAAGSPRVRNSAGCAGLEGSRKAPCRRERQDCVTSVTRDVNPIGHRLRAREEGPVCPRAAGSPTRALRVFPGSSLAAGLRASGS